MPQPPASPPVQQFLARVSELAGRLGVRSLLIALVDPGTGVPRIVMTPGAKEQLRATLVEDLQVIDPQASNARSQAARLLGTDESSESDTGWDG